jgi:hypothetical protein
MGSPDQARDAMGRFEAAAGEAAAATYKARNGFDPQEKLDAAAAHEKAAKAADAAGRPDQAAQHRDNAQTFRAQHEAQVTPPKTSNAFRSSSLGMANRQATAAAKPKSAFGLPFNPKDRTRDSVDPEVQKGVDARAASTKANKSGSQTDHNQAAQKHREAASAMDKVGNARAASVHRMEAATHERAVIEISNKASKLGKWAGSK